MSDRSFDPSQVRDVATQMRIDIIEMLTAAGSGHPGGSLSAADIVATLYFGGVLRHDSANPKDPARDRFVLCKGHAAPVLYAALGEAGYFSKDEFSGLRHLGRMLQGHPDASKTPGVEVSTGSLGQGLSIASGLAQGLAMDGGDQQVYALLGDGELQEGQVWEAAMYAAHHRIANLTAIVDFNGLQIDGFCQDVLAIGSPAEKFGAFGWDVVEVDGHDVEQLHRALTAPRTSDKPRAIIAKTFKGKGVSFMHNEAGWHGVAPSEEQAVAACGELRACFEGGER